MSDSEMSDLEEEFGLVREETGNGRLPVTGIQLQVAVEECKTFTALK